MNAVVGKMWEPLLKSQRVDGRERDAGWDWSSGVSKRERAAMAPEVRRETEMLAVLTAVVREAIAVMFSDIKDFGGEMSCEA